VEDIFRRYLMLKSYHSQKDLRQRDARKRWHTG
jgi:hypothetical protein